MTDVAFSPGSDRLFTSSLDGTAMAWDLGGEDRLGRTTTRPYTASVVAQDLGQSFLVLTPGASGANLWDPVARRAFGPPVPGLGSFQAAGTVGAAAVDADRTRLATADQDGSLRPWDLATGSALGRLFADQGSPVTRVGFDPSGTTLAAGLQDGRVVLWDVAQQVTRGRPLRHRCGCGTSRTPRRSRPSTSMPAPCSAWPSAPTAPRWPRPGATDG